MSSANNPLLDLPFAVPFDRIKPEHVKPAMAALLKEAKENLAAIKTAPLTYEATFGALDDATDALDKAMTIVGHLESVASTDELREVYNEVKPDISAFYASISLDTELYQALLNYSETGEAEKLSGPKARFVEKTLEDFRRHGAELEGPDKARLEAMSREMAEYTSKFGQNLVDATAEYELLIDDESRLAGLPESAMAAAKQSAEEKGQEGWRFTLQAPSLIPVLTYLDDAEIRETIYRAYNNRAAGGERDNPGLIEKIRALRAEKASLLGYETFADLVLADRMAKNGQTAKDFIARLEEKARPAFERENAELLAFRRSIEGPEAPTLRPWDVGYYAEKQRQALYEFDDEELRPYFPLASVMTGLFETAHRLYGVKVVETDMPGWHETVQTYRLEDEDGTFLGSFYADVYPREEKRGGAWMNSLVSGVSLPGIHEPQLGLICANVTPPVGDKPALLTHDEVQTMFHEFGHLLHHLLSRVEVRSMVGTNVAWDFVELPSQIMENWCWERQALDTFALHYETGDPIPDGLFSKMKKARTFRAANATMRQLGFATLDLTLHTEYDAERDGDVLAWSRSVLERFAPASYFDGYAFIAGFGHLFSSAVGYAAGYYSYKWAEVLDADAFTRFREEGIFSREVGSQFRKHILEKGDGEDPELLYKNFMGRAPRLESLLERDGLM